MTKYLSASLIYKEDNTAIDLIIVMLHMILQISVMQKQNCKFRTCTPLYIKICIFDIFILTLDYTIKRCGSYLP